jgi:hypothetical protein
LNKLIYLSINKYSATIFLTIIFLGILTFVTSNEPLIFFSNFIIPDGISYLFYLEKIRQGNTILEVAQEQFPSIPNSALLWYFYAPIFQTSGAIGIFIVNLTLVSIINKFIDPRTLIFLPYFIVSAILPSKDLLVLALLIPLVTSLISNQIFLAMAISLALFFIRDGAGIIAMVIVASYLTYRHLRLKPGTIAWLAFLVAFFTNSFMPDLLGGSFIYERNLSVSQIYSNPIINSGSILDYPIRVFANVSNLSFRQPIFDIDGNLAIYPLSLYISGTSNLAVFILTIKTLSQKNTSNEIRLISLFFLVSIFAISLSPFVGPRYQLPMTVIAVSYLLSNSFSKKIFYKYFLISLLCSMLAILLYSVTIGYPVPSSPGPIL